MKLRQHRHFFPVALFLVLGSAFGHAQSGSTPPGGLPPKPVGVITLAQQSVPRVVALPGRAVAYQSVAIRPRVEGVIKEVYYSPGEELQVGAPLFRIDDASYRAQVATDRANLRKAEAALEVAQSQHKRAKKLAGTTYTEAQVETARLALAEAQAALDAARAALELSETRLGWTTVTSPIIGRPEVAAVSVGDLVSAGQANALTTVVRSDPIYVDMVDASAHRVSVRQQVDAGQLALSTDLAASLMLENGTVYHGTGKVVTLGNIVSTSTGTFTVRFAFENPDHVILPGMFLRGEFTLGTATGFLIPQRAATRDKSGQLNVYLVDAENKARQVAVQDDGSYRNNWLVFDGVEAGDRLIVDGLKSLQHGQAVAPVVVHIDDDGITRDVATEAQN